MSYDLLFFRVKKGGDLQEALRLFGATEGEEFPDDTDGGLDEDEEGDDADEDEDEEEIDPDKLPFDISLDELEILENLAVPYLSALVPPEERSTELIKWLKIAAQTPRKARDIDGLPDEARESLEFMMMGTPGVHMLDVGRGELGPVLKAICAALKPLAARGIYVLDPQMGVLMPEDPADEYYDVDEDADDGIDDDDDEE